MIWGMDDSTVLGLTGIIAGLLTASISFLWSYKTRALSHREFLYQKQIEGYLELSTTMIRLLDPCYDFLIDNQLTPKNRARLSNILDKVDDGLRREVIRCQAILPLDVASAVNEMYGKVANAKLESFEQIVETLMMAEWDVYAAIRKNAGVDPLTEDMRRVFGQR